MPASHIVGIDLGTTNCALASARLEEGASATVHDFPVPQLIRIGQTGPQPLLPSFLYSTGEHELPAGAATLPWGDSPGFVVGEFARWQGARVPGRLISSAKSWLCHPGVDRSAAILPWGAPPEVCKLSPTDASAMLLRHLAQAWDHAHPEAPLREQEVVITVPASFDEVARSLTVAAAQRAGLENFTLVEEPQAAFYDFTARRRHDLGVALADIRLVLVVDVGGGTSDFTLIQTYVGEEGPALKRIAVGEHLMLGGDNMDAALARKMEERWTATGRRLSAGQWTQLVQAARGAKERLLALDAPERHAVSLVGEGSKLLGATLSTEIGRADVEALVLDGFFPFSASSDLPRKATGRVALQELGLPYAQDAAITRHLAAFLRHHVEAAKAALGTGVPTEDGILPRPDAILLNGGVFNSAAITDRLVEVLSSWWPNQPRIPLLHHDSLELAVARGAAYYGLVRRGFGRRIGGGTAQAFYVGVGEGRQGAAGNRAICVVPRGQEEGKAIDIDQRSFDLTIGRPVQFPLFSTTADRADQAGDLITLDDGFRRLPPIHSLLRATSGTTGTIPVHLRAGLTEIGTLELWCVANASTDRWRLEFDLRGSARSEADTVIESMPARFADVRGIVERIYGATPQVVEPKEVKHLRQSLEDAIGAREAWSLPVLREIWGALLAGANKRRRSVEHERVFYQLLGYTLRPGFGYPLDEWRCEQTFRLFREGVTARGDTTVWREFWILWRRIAGGLNEQQQAEMWEFLKPHLARQVPAKSKNTPKPKGPQPQGSDEMVRVAAALEHLPAGEKSGFGRWIVDRLEEPELRAGPWAWALGRLGARVPLYGSAHHSVDPAQVEEWLRTLLRLRLDRVEGAPFAAAQMARRTGDRARDIDEALRSEVTDALRAGQAPERWITLVNDVVDLEQADEARALGDTLPIGLKV